MAVNVFSQPGGRDLVYPANSSTARTQQQATNSLLSTPGMQAPQQGQTYGGLQRPGLGTPQSMGPNNAADASSKSTGNQAQNAGPAPTQANRSAGAPPQNSSAPQSTLPETPKSNPQKQPQPAQRIHVGNSPFLARLRGAQASVPVKTARCGIAESQLRSLVVSSSCRETPAFYGVYGNDDLHSKEAFIKLIPSIASGGAKAWRWGKNLFTGTSKLRGAAGAATKAPRPVAGFAAGTGGAAKAAVPPPAPGTLKRFGANALDKVMGAGRGAGLGFGADTLHSFVAGRDLDTNYMGYGAAAGLASRFIPAKYRALIPGKGLGSWAAQGLNQAATLGGVGSIQERMTGGQMNVARPWMMRDNAVNGVVEQGMGQVANELGFESADELRQFAPQARDAIQRLPQLEQEAAAARQMAQQYGPLLNVLGPAAQDYVKARRSLNLFLGKPDYDTDKAMEYLQWLNSRDRGNHPLM